MTYKPVKKNRIFSPRFCTGFFASLLALAAVSAKADNHQDPDKHFPNGHFAFGIELGSSIDVSGYDMSTFDADINIGFKNNFIRTVGLGTGVHRSFGTRDTYVPVYFLFRSSFSSRPQPLFMHLQAGYSFNTLADSPTFGDTTACIGLGINLSSSRKFRTHIIVGYCFRHFDTKHQDMTRVDRENVSLAQLSFGINF